MFYLLISVDQIPFAQIPFAFEFDPLNRLRSVLSLTQIEAITTHTPELLNDNSTYYRFHQKIFFTVVKSAELPIGTSISSATEILGYFGYTNVVCINLAQVIWGFIFI